MTTTLASAIAAGVLLVAAGSVASHPQLKEGLWSVHTRSSSPGRKPTEGSYSICRSQAFDEHTESLAKAMKGCTTVSDKSAGDKESLEMRCLIGPTVIVSKSTVTIQGNISTHAEVITTYTPALEGTSEDRMIMDQKYVGKCPAGTGPGDRTNRDGVVTHLWKH